MPGIGHRPRVHDPGRSLRLQARRMRIDIVVGRRWHAPQLAGALVQLGHDVRVVSTDTFDAPNVRLPLRTALRAGERLEFGSALSRSAFGVAAAAIVRRGSLCIGWSSYTAPTLATRRGHDVILVRGSHHIRRQRDLLGPAGPTTAIVRLEEFEYARALMVSVPTQEIASDPYFSQSGANAAVAPYGFPSRLASSSLNLSPSPRRVLFAGEIGHRKGFDLLLEAFGQQSPDFEFALAGPTRLNAADFPAHWRYLGVLSAAGVQAAMRDSSCLVLPSREEGMARVGQEAMAAGCPVIATPRSGLGKWIREGAGVVLPDEPSGEHIRAAVSWVLQGGPGMRRTSYDVAGSWTWTDHASLVLDQFGALKSA